MSDITHGACLCGGLRFRILGPLAPIQVCHCSQCRRAQGGPFATNIPVGRATLRIDAGEDLIKAYESSPGKRRVFCSVCASPFYSERDSLPGVVRIRAGLLAEPVASHLEFQAYVGAKASWWVVDDGLERHEGAHVPALPLSDSPLRSGA
jgi:hypothetical protein